MEYCGDNFRLNQVCVVSANNWKSKNSEVYDQVVYNAQSHHYTP